MPPWSLAESKGRVASQHCYKRAATVNRAKVSTRSIEFGISLRVLLGWGELDSMRPRNQDFGDVAGCARIKMDSKRLKLNPDTHLGRHNSLRYRTVGANAIIPLFEPNRSNPGTQLTNIRNFGNTNHTCLDWMH